MPTMTSGRSAFFNVSANVPRPAAISASVSGPAPRYAVGIGQVGPLADQPDREIAGAPALADARIEHGRLVARIGADDQQRVGLLDAGDGGIEQVGRPAPLRVERGAILPAIEIADAEPAHQVLEREHLLDRGEIAGNRADARRRRRLDLGGDRAERLRPGCGAQPAVLADVRLVEALAAQAVDDVARLVGNPLLVHVVVDARQDAHHLAAAGVDADRGADRVHDVDRFGLVQLPRPRREGIGLRGQRADRAEIDDVALQLRRHRGFEIGGDLHVLAAADGAELRHARDFGGEADAAGAMDAAVHHRLDQRADILVLDRALVLVIAAVVDAVGHRLVLQIALAALVADRAIERMVDQQELHHPFARLAHHRALGVDHLGRAVAVRRQVLHAHRAGRLRLRHADDLDQAHAAVAGDRQPLVEAEARNLGARGFARLEQRVLRRHLDLASVDDELGHWLVNLGLKPFDAFRQVLDCRFQALVTFVGCHSDTESMCRDLVEVVDPTCQVSTRPLRYLRSVPWTSVRISRSNRRTRLSGSSAIEILLPLSHAHRAVFHNCAAGRFSQPNA